MKRLWSRVDCASGNRGKPAVLGGLCALFLLPTYPLVQLRPILPASVVSLSSASTAAGCAGGAVRRAYAGPYLIPLTSPSPNGLRGAGMLAFAESPFGVSLTPEGHYVYDLEVQIDGLRNRRVGTPVVWATTPELDEVQRVGVIGPDGRARGKVSFNKMLVFVTLEADPEVTQWQGPIVLRGISASGLMHTMAGHGPFEGVEC